MKTLALLQSPKSWLSISGSHTKPIGKEGRITNTVGNDLEFTLTKKYIIENLVMSTVWGPSPLTYLVTDIPVESYCPHQVSNISYSGYLNAN